MTVSLLAVAPGASFVSAGHPFDARALLLAAAADVRVEWADALGGLR